MTGLDVVVLMVAVAVGALAGYGAVKAVRVGHARWRRWRGERAHQRLLEQVQPFIASNGLFVEVRDCKCGSPLCSGHEAHVTHGTYGVLTVVFPPTGFASEAARTLRLVANGRSDLPEQGLAPVFAMAEFFDRVAVLEDRVKK